MSAREVIEQIEQLTIEEREKVFAFVMANLEKQPMVLRDEALAEARKQPTRPEARFVDDATFKKAVDWVFTEHEGLMRRLSQ
jgi:hypothetical protein